MGGYPFFEIDFLDRFLIKTPGEQAKGDKNVKILFRSYRPFYVQKERSL
jgi:hypothetical protein